MGRNIDSSTVEVAQGVYIKQISPGAPWHYYFKVGKRQFRKSTKTSDRTAASHLVLNDYFSALAKQKTGSPVDKVSFKKLSAKYLEHIQSQHKHKFHSETTARHLMPFFEKFQDVSKITGKDIFEYQTWRQKKSNHLVSNQTISLENSVLRQTLAFGMDCGWVSRDLKVKNFRGVKSKRRRHFTRSEYALLLQTARIRAREFTHNPKLSGKDRGLMTTNHWQRNLLLDIIVLFAATGLRVDEMKTITWRDINWDNQEIQLRAAGKTKSSRRVYVRVCGMTTLRALLSRRLAYVKIHNATFSENEPIQALPNGRFVRSLRKSFDALLQACGFEYADSKDGHALTSLRHTYATFRLTNSRGIRASVRGLAKQMGTSDRMIEKHYGHDDVSDYKVELIG